MTFCRFCTANHCGKIKKPKLKNLDGVRSSSFGVLRKGYETQFTMESFQMVDIGPEKLLKHTKNIEQEDNLRGNF